MKTIVFAARKGGCSKSTLCAHLAVEASRTQPVTLVDTDPQATLTDWWHSREAESPELMDVPLVTLGRELELVASKPGLVMIDTPPNDSATIAAVIQVADMVVIPCKASPNDLRGITATVDMVKAAGKPFVIVIVQAIVNALVTEEARAVLAGYGTVLPVAMFNRVDFIYAMTDGRVAKELDSTSKAAEEIASIWKSVSKQLNKSAR